jgi:hypothetical protein
MVNKLVFLFLILNAGICSAQDFFFQDSSIVFDKTTYDFGLIDRNSTGIATFKVENQNEKSLIIQHVKGQCGCTSSIIDGIPGWIEVPLHKGESTNIRIKYDTTREGKFDKKIMVYTNFNEKPILLSIKGEVKKS